MGITNRIVDVYVVMGDDEEIYAITTHLSDAREVVEKVKNDVPPSIYYIWMNKDDLRLVEDNRGVDTILRRRR
jgi:hypothetical protein